MSGTYAVHTEHSVAATIIGGLRWEKVSERERERESQLAAKVRRSEPQEVYEGVPDTAKNEFAVHFSLFFLSNSTF
jgi:hypothetical protein